MSILIQGAVVSRCGKSLLIFFFCPSYHLAGEVEAVGGSALQGGALNTPALLPEDYREEDKRPIEPESTVQSADSEELRTANP